MIKTTITSFTADETRPSVVQKEEEKELI